MSELSAAERQRIWEVMDPESRPCCGGLHDITPVVEALIDERMEAAGTWLLRKAGNHFEAEGPESRFGAGIWAAGSYLREKYDADEQLEAARWITSRRLEQEYGSE